MLGESLRKRSRCAFDNGGGPYGMALKPSRTGRNPGGRWCHERSNRPERPFGAIATGLVGLRTPIFREDGTAFKPRSAVRSAPAGRGRRRSARRPLPSRTFSPRPGGGIQHPPPDCRRAPRAAWGQAQGEPSKDDPARSHRGHSLLRSRCIIRGRCTRPWRRCFHRATRAAPSRRCHPPSTGTVTDIGQTMAARMTTSMARSASSDRCRQRNCGARTKAR